MIGHKAARAARAASPTTTTHSRRLCASFAKARSQASKPRDPTPGAVIHNATAAMARQNSMRNIMPMENGRPKNQLEIANEPAVIRAAALSVCCGKHLECQPYALERGLLWTKCPKVTRRALRVSRLRHLLIEKPVVICPQKATLPVPLVPLFSLSDGRQEENPCCTTGCCLENWQSYLAVWVLSFPVIVEEFLRIERSKQRRGTNQ